MKAVFVLFDSLCRNALGCYGSPWGKTPNFDRFSRAAVTFDRHFVGRLPCPAAPPGEPNGGQGRPHPGRTNGRLVEGEKTPAPRVLFAPLFGFSGRNPPRRSVVPDAGMLRPARAVPGARALQGAVCDGLEG